MKMANYKCSEVSDVLKDKYRTMIVDTLENNQWYRNIVGKTIINRSMSFDDIYNLLPYMNKDMLNGYESYCKATGNEEYEFTSGSTGVPLKCYKNKYERSLLAIYIMRLRKRVDNKFNNNSFLYLMGKQYDTKIDFTNLAESNLKLIIDYIEYKKPRWLCLSPTMAVKYAEFLESSNIRLNSVKYIELQGESLSDEEKVLIERAFQAKVIIQYGLRETWTVAYQCKFNHLHVLDENVFVEIKNCDQDGFGEIVLTSKIIKTMPIIKYMTGDIGKIFRINKCKCGKQNTNVLCIKEGRKTNVIYGHESFIGDILFKRLMMISLNKFQFDSRIVKNYWVEQVDKDVFIVRIVKGDHYDDIIEKRFEKHAKRALGDNTNIIFLYEKKAMLNSNGKNKLFICTIKE